MTDNEIIKAIRCCAANGSCDGCPLNYGEHDDMCVIINLRNALDLINRQRAEIERLERKTEDLESVQEISPEAKHFIDTKADKVISLMNELIKSQEQIKAEAVKEFAERLKATFPPRNSMRCTLDDCYTLDMIDNIAKEMVGEQG